MRIDYDLNYILKIEEVGGGKITDLALGTQRVTERDHEVIRCGIDNHSISFIINEVLENSDNHFKFIDRIGNVITFDVVDEKLFEEYRDILFNNAPSLQHERDIQEWINSVRFAY